MTETAHNQEDNKPNEDVDKQPAVNVQQHQQQQDVNNNNNIDVSILLHTLDLKAVDTIGNFSK